MARILVQTNDYLTVLDEREIRVADMQDGESAGNLVARLGRAVQEAENTRSHRRRMPGRRAVMAAASDYREVYG